MRKGLRLLAALLVVGAISTVGLVTSALAGTVPEPADITIPLQNDTADPGTDCPTTGTYWHFVISPNNGESYFITFHLNLGDATTYDTSIFVPNGSQLDNVFVAVPSGKTLTSLIKEGSTADIHWSGEGSEPAKFQLSHTCGGTIPPAADPTVTKDAEGAYDETFVWTPDKSADKETVYTAGGAESEAVNYTVSVSHDEGTVSNVKVSGTITVGNPNDGDIELDSVSDELSDGTDCTVDPADLADLTIPANGTKGFDYECELDALPEGDLTNTATIAWSAQTLSDGSELAANSVDSSAVPISFTATQIDECTTVDDTNPNGPQDEEVCVGDDNPTEFEYSETFSDPEGTCTEHENTASIETNDTETTDEAKTTVEDCQGADLTVTKTATPSFTRAYDWTITKEVDQDAPGSTTFDYTVTVEHDAGTDSDWQVVGTITITNPNDWQDITLTSLSDTIDNGGDCTLDDAGPYEVPASGSIDVDYTCTYASAPDPAAFKNTATAGWDKDAAHTPNGSASGDKSDAFGDPTTEIDECIDVVDDNGTPANTADDKVLGQVCVGGDNPTVFEYSKTLTLGDAQCVTYTNTSSFTTTDDANDTDEHGSDSVTVSYCRPATIGYWKTHMYQCGPRERTGTNGCNNNGPFTVTYLPQYLGNYLVNDTTKALAVFNANNCSNASSSDNNAAACLAAQLLGAKLNVAFGSPSCIAATITAADNFLKNNVTPSYNGPTGGPYSLNTRAQAIALKTTLDNYNKGLGCPV